MAYFVLFLEGVVTFISPCLLPMLPIYLVYFAAGDTQRGGKKTLVNAVGFVLGFTLIFVSMGAFAGTVGKLFLNNPIVDIIMGAIVVAFGLNYCGLLRIEVLNRTKKLGTNIKPGNFFTTVLFGMIFAVGWTPCVGAFLGSALLLASQQGSVLQGILMLFVYAMGLGIPFILSAILIDSIKGAVGFIKKHYNIVNMVCGVLLVIVGVLMMTGLFSKFITALIF